jgi:hypothetical protein
MTGGAGWKMAPSMSVQFELVDSLIFDGLLEIAQRRTPIQLNRERINRKRALSDRSFQAETAAHLRVA